MNDATKLTSIKSILHFSDNSHDAELGVYLDLAKNEILSWMYSAAGSIPEDVTDVPAFYEPTQIFAVVVGYGINGAENQVSHNENGVSRSFKYEDMLAYIRAKVMPFVGVM